MLLKAKVPLAGANAQAPGKLPEISSVLFLFCRFPLTSQPPILVVGARMCGVGLDQGYRHMCTLSLFTEGDNLHSSYPIPGEDGFRQREDGLGKEMEGGKESERDRDTLLLLLPEKRPWSSLHEYVLLCTAEVVSFDPAELAMSSQLCILTR